MIRKLLTAFGCLVLLGPAIVRGQAPGTDFSANPTTGCAPLAVQFKDLSSNNPTAWNWDFGNGQTATTQNPQATYSLPGTYTVTLISKNSSGANAMRKTNYITVYPSPSVSFSSNLTLACIPANIQFLDKSTAGQGSITSWLWNFGDSSTSTQQDPIHVYSQPGYYTVSLKVTNSGGCSAYAPIPRYLRLVNGIQPDFTYNQTSGSCTAPFTLNFINQTAGPGNLTFNWSLGNGAVPQNSTDTNPSNVTYPSSGSYNVNLQVTSSLGCNASIQKTLPLAGNSIAINGPDTICINNPATFSNASSPKPVSTTWSFGDGTGANTDTATKTYTVPGAYSLKLVDKYVACADSITQLVHVINPPVVAFTASPVEACKPSLTVTFTNQSTGATSYLWNFGDLQTSTQPNPTHTYSTVGTFNVTLTATGPGGCPNTTIKSAFINIQAPSVTIGGTLGACVSSTANFRIINPVAHVISVDSVSSYAWSAPGSNEDSSSAASPAFTYPDSGNYTISVIVTTKGGCSVSASASVQIGTPRSAAFTASPNPVCSRNLVTFQAATTTASNWIWTFGDHSGNSSSGSPTATYSYKYYGSHTVTLTVINNGCSQQDSLPEVIDPPFALFTDSLEAGCTNKFLVAFRDTSYSNLTYGPISWHWDFGDTASGGANDTSDLQNPIHAFTPGSPTVTYNVELIITNGTCKDSITTPVILGVVAPSFTPPPPPSFCRNTPVTFTSTSTPVSLISTYSWQVDGGAPVTAASPTFQASFSTNGPHNVTLTDTDTYHCPYSVTNTFQITGPKAQFSAPAGGCRNSPVAFTDASTPYPGSAGPPPLPGNPLTSWSWNFGDSTPPASGPNPTHAYADTGFFYPQLIVTDNANCSDTATMALPIQITAPTANFFGPDSFYCAGVPLPLIDSSLGYGLKESWNYGDGTTGDTSVHTFPTSGTTYTVSLTVTDKYGCTSSVSKPIRIQNPIAAFNIADTTAICWPLQTFFVAHGQYYDSLYWNFGDGSTSTLDSTSHFYNTYGIDTAKLFVQGPGGCLDSASRRVLVLNPFLSTSLTNIPNPAKACDSLLVTFDITPTPYSLFTLYFGDNSADSSQDTTISHMYRNPMTYGPILTLTDPSGCIVNIPSLSPVYILGSTPFFSVDKRAFCDSGVVNFTDFSFSNDGMASETYNFGDGSPLDSIDPGSGSFNASHFYDQPGNFLASLKVTTNSGCSETYTDTINVYPIPHPSITVLSAPCDGNIQFQGNSTAIPASDSVSWNWNFGNSQTSTIQDPTVPMTPGTYTVTLKATVPPLGCNDTTSTSITIHPLPVIKGPKQLSTPVGIPITIPFTYSSGLVSYNWSPPTYLDCPSCPNPVATLIYSQEYAVTVTDSSGCMATDSILINTICNDKNYFLPNTFSPNGDGVNDQFYPRGSNLYNIQSMTIFNRWGQMVFQRRDFPANDPSMGWDGTFNGRPAPSDAYVYIVEVICDNAQVVALHGNVTLIR